MSIQYYAMRVEPFMVFAIRVCVSRDRAVAIHAPPAPAPGIRCQSLCRHRLWVCATIAVSGKAAIYGSSLTEVRLTGRIKGASADPCADGVLVESQCRERVFYNTEYGFRTGS